LAFPTRVTRKVPQAPINPHGASKLMAQRIMPHSATASRCFNTVYQMDDETHLCDSIQVTDLAKAHVLALKALEQGLAHRPSI